MNRIAETPQDFIAAIKSMSAFTVRSRQLAITLRVPDVGDYRFNAKGEPARVEKRAEGVSMKSVNEDDMRAISDAVRADLATLFLLDTHESAHGRPAMTGVLHEPRGCWGGQAVSRH